MATHGGGGRRGALGYRVSVLGLVTSLPHPANCASYRARSELLVGTLRSVLRQRDPDIHVVVVANEPPECDLPADDRVEVVRVPFPPSSSPLGKPSLQGIEIDKGAKLSVGTSRVLARGAQHVMWVDSDDFIHRDIASYAAAHPDEYGWYFDSGYFHIRGGRRVTTVLSEYHQRNGTSHVIRGDILGVPPDLAPDLTRDEVLDVVGRERATQTMGRHRPVVEFFRAQGTPLAPFPFPAAIWELGTGENCTGVVAAAGPKVPIDGRIAEDFGLPVPSRAEAARSSVEILTQRVARHLRRPG
jgi:hypothetical protein